MNDRAAEPYAHVHDALLRPLFRLPGVHDAVAADEGDMAVDDRKLAVVALVQDADVGEVRAVKLAKLAAGILEPLLHVLAHPSRSIGVEQHADFDTGPGAPDHRLREARSQRALLPEKSLEMHGVARLVDLVDQGVEERAIFQHFDAVAVDDRAEREPGQRRDQLLDRRVAVDRELRVAVPLHRPDEQDEEPDRAGDRQHRHRCRNFQFAHVRPPGIA